MAISSISGAAAPTQQPPLQTAQQGAQPQAGQAHKGHHHRPQQSQAQGGASATASASAAPVAPAVASSGKGVVV